MRSPNLPRHLYKYREFNVNTLRLLDFAEVYYADPRSFNDPLDSNPTIQVDTDLASLERLLYQMLSATQGKDVARKTMSNHRYMSTEYGDYKTDPDVAAYYTRRLASHISDLLSTEQGRRGVLSLASKWDCPLMWSHYADEHRGLCIEYTLSDAAFNNLLQVSYSRSRAVRISELIDWKMKGNQSAEQKIVDTFFFSKAPQWRYEREWRDLAEAPGTASAPAYVNAIIFGLRCDPTVITTVVKLHAQSARPIKFYAVRPSDGSFRLKRDAIDKDEIESTGVPSPAVLEFRDVFVDFADA